ncbi:MAG TPA: ABC transporter ATP-binding protein [Actinomycetota bacterium]|nr:ABC transporter ATP-binding protein [Actinomycetota bacterium]
MGAAPAVEARGLRKSYGPVQALRGVDFTVFEGEVFALLGPNGAGKTTTVEILEGYRTRDGGEVRVLGLDPARGGRALRRRIGIVLQATGLEPYLTVAETLDYYRAAYPVPRPVEEVLELAGLGDLRDTRVGRLSGGQLRRLDVAVALVGDPELLFLDEPTTGFDPEARRGAWEVIRSLAGLGKTVLLTTHYLDEAQALADRVAVLAEGRVVAEGPPEAIGGRREAATVVRFRLPPEAPPLPAGLAPEAQATGGLVELRTEDPTRLLHDLTGWALEHGVALEALEVSRPSLEDVYLELTRQAQDPPSGDARDPAGDRGGREGR